MLKSVSSAELLHEFDTHIEPHLAAIASEGDLQRRVEMISAAQHSLFAPFVKRVNTSDHFASAFWRLANHVIPVAKDVSACLESHSPLLRVVKNKQASRTLWLVKGPFDLAHMDCVKNFLFGWRQYNATTRVPQDQHYLLFLDSPIPQSLVGSKYAFSFATKRSVMLKLYRLRELSNSLSIDSIIWPGVFQDMSLYMGIRNAPQQIFWSAKHRIQIMPETLDQYFFGGFSKRTIYHQGVPWKYGRFDLTPWKGMHRLENLESNSKKNAPDDAVPMLLKEVRKKHQVVFGSVCVEHKYSSPAFWAAIDQILGDLPQAAYCFSGRSVLPEVKTILNKLAARDRIYYVGWHDNVDDALGYFDIYLDAFPFGSSHVLYQCWRRELPTISLRSSENIRLSIHHSLSSVPSLVDNHVFSFPALADSVSQYIHLAVACATNGNLSVAIASQQYQIIDSCMANPAGMYADFSEHISDGLALLL